MNKFILLVIAAAGICLFTACSKEEDRQKQDGGQNAVQQSVAQAARKSNVNIPSLPEDTLPIPKDNSYVKDLYRTMLELKLYLQRYIRSNHKYPEDLRELKFPGMKIEVIEIMMDENTKKDHIKGYFNKLDLDDPIYVQYDRNAFGIPDNILLTVSYGANFPKNRAYMQYKGDLVSCVAATGIAPANEACKVLYPIKEHIDPIRSYYYVGSELSEAEQAEILDRISMIDAKEKAIIADLMIERKREFERRKNEEQKKEEAIKAKAADVRAEFAKKYPDEVTTQPALQESQTEQETPAAKDPIEEEIVNQVMFH